MKHVLCFAALLLFAVGCQMLGCGDASSPMTASDGGEAAEPGATLPPEPVVIAPTPAEETFGELQRLFPQPMLDEGFTTLRAVTQSQPYLAFLAREFPIDEPFQTYEAYLQGAPPPAERYLGFLKKWIGVPTDEDIAAIHRMTIATRKGTMRVFREDFGLKELIDAFAKPLETITVNENAFLMQHQLDKLEKFSPAFFLFVVETEKADARWLHEQFEARGEENGLLWSALRKPALIGEILNNFAETTAFLRWVEATGAPE